MYRRLALEGRHAVARAQDAARRLGAAEVEPVHLLVALAEGETDPAARALAEAGLGPDRIERAIEQDLVAALSVVGVPASVVESTPIYPVAGRPGWSEPVKLALQRAVQAAGARGDRHLGTEHLLLGLLKPPAVGVRRVLAVLDVEPRRLAALVQVEVAAGR